MINLGQGIKVHVRPSFSDNARVSEFYQSLYFNNNVLTAKVIEKNPSVIIDIGANIGLSSLSLSIAFKGVKKVIGVEAEKENYEVLKKNYSYWMDSNTSTRVIEYLPIYAVATNSRKASSSGFKMTKLTQGTSASGTFRFENSDLEPNEIVEGVDYSHKVISIENIINKFTKYDDVIVIKIDIEGGEEHLFSDDCSWLKRVTFITAELHDRFGVPKSSLNMLAKLVEYNYAVVPDKDILHCYNRSYLGL